MTCLMCFRDSRNFRCINIAASLRQRPLEFFLQGAEIMGGINLTVIQGQIALATRIQGARTSATKLAAAAKSLKHASGVTGAAFCLAFMTDSARAPHPEIIARVMPRGSAVILRDYENPHRAALARRLRSITKKTGTLLIIGADPALSEKVGADGVHYPSWASPKPAREGVIITAACHEAEDLTRAKDVGANLAFLSPVFATNSHPDAKTLGIERFKALAAASPLPVIALGGVDEVNAGALQGRNVVGLAAISAFFEPSRAL